MAEPLLSEVRIMSFQFAPKGWAFCKGQLLDGIETAAFFDFDFDITIQVNETSGASIRVPQANSAAIGTANNGNSVSIFENPPNAAVYNQPACAVP